MVPPALDPPAAGEPAAGDPAAAVAAMVAWAPDGAVVAEPPELQALATRTTPVPSTLRVLSLMNEPPLTKLLLAERAAAKREGLVGADRRFRGGTALRRPPPGFEPFFPYDDVP